MGWSRNLDSIQRKVQPKRPIKFPQVIKALRNNKQVEQKMNKFALLLTACVLLVAFSLITIQPIHATSQAQLQWSKTYYGDSGQAIQTTDGGYAIAANNASIAFYPDYERAPMLIKTDSSGNLQWNETFNTVGLVAVSAFMQTKDGGYALSGSNVAGSALNPNFTGWLIKTDAKGAVEWNQTFDALQTCYAVQTNDGGFALIGYMKNSYGGGDGVLIKVDGQGNKIWTKTFGGNSSNAFFISMIQASDGGYVIVGNWNQDGWLVKTDANGNLQWNQKYHHSGYATFPLVSLAETSDGGYILAGGTIPVNGNPGGGFLVKTDEDGNLVWFKSYSEASIINTVVQAPDGGFLGTSTQNRQAVVIKTDSSGALLYNISYGQVGENVTSLASSVVVTNNNEFAVSGNLDNYYPTTASGFEVTPSVGNHVWLATFISGPSGSSSSSTPEFPSIIILSLLVITLISSGLLVYFKKHKLKK